MLLVCMFDIFQFLTALKVQPPNFKEFSSVFIGCFKLDLSMIALSRTLLPGSQSSSILSILLLSEGPSTLSRFLGDLLYFCTFRRSFYSIDYTFTHSSILSQHLEDRPSIISHHLKDLLYLNTFILWLPGSPCRSSPFLCTPSSPPGPYTTPSQHTCNQIMHQFIK